MKLLLLTALVPSLVAVSALHYAGFLCCEWLHLYVFEPVEVRLAAAIGRIYLA